MTVVVVVYVSINHLYLVSGVNGRESLFSFDVCLCVRLCTADRSIIAPKELKLLTSDLTCMFPGTVGYDPLKFF